MGRGRLFDFAGFMQGGGTMANIGLSRELPYRVEELFDVAVDVERYPGFVPGWRSATVSQRSESGYITDQVVGFGPVIQRFRTRTVLHRPEEISVTALDGPFDAFQLRWRFEARPHDRCLVRLDGKIEMRSMALRVLSSHVATSFADAMLAAFESRARQLHAAAAP